MPRSLAGHLDGPRRPERPMAPVTTLYCGSKSTYPPPPASAQHVDAPAGHRLTHVTLLSRHGTRTPSRGSLERMRRLYTELSQSAPTLPWLPSWAADLTAFSARVGRLSREGASELWGLGARFGARYRSLLCAAGGRPAVASASSDGRCGASGSHFLAGLADAGGLPDGAPTIRRDADKTLRYCWLDRAYARFARAHVAQAQRRLRAGGMPGFDAPARRIARALGVPLRREHVPVIADAAAFDVALGRAGASPFVRLLEADDAQAVAAYDAAARPVLAWGRRQRTLCAPLVRALVRTLKLAQMGRAPVAELMFAHSETLVPLLLLLGIDGSVVEGEGGGLRQGIAGMSPFAGNFAVEVFENQMGPGHLVRFRLHERYVAEVPALGEKGRHGRIRLGDLLAFFQGVIEEDDMNRGSEKISQ